MVGVLCLFINFVSCISARCMLFASMNCVSCSSLFLIPSMLCCRMFMLWVLWCMFMLAPVCGGLFGGVVCGCGDV